MGSPDQMHLFIKALVPTAAAGWILAVDTANALGSWMVRLDSSGRQIGSPMGMRHGECLQMMLLDADGGTWAAPRTGEDSASTLYRFDSAGGFVDSTAIAPKGRIEGIFFVSGKLVTSHLSSTDRIQWFQMYGPKSGNPSGPIERLHVDSIQGSRYFSEIESYRGPSGEDHLVFAGTTGVLDVTNGTSPDVRVVDWVVKDDRMERRFDAINELSMPEAVWIGKSGNLMVAGIRRTDASLGSMPKFDPALTILDSQGKSIRTTAIHLAGSLKVDIASVFAGSYPDGSSFLGVSGYQNPTSVTILDPDGDSASTHLLATTFSVNVWYAHPGGRIVNLGMSYDGSARSIESWTTTAGSDVRDRADRTSRLRVFQRSVSLNLERNVTSATLDRLDLQGRILESRSLGSLPRGRHDWKLPSIPSSLVRVHLDDEILVAKVPHLVN